MSTCRCTLGKSLLPKTSGKAHPRVPDAHKPSWEEHGMVASLEVSEE